jgi:protein TonB
MNNLLEGDEEQLERELTGEPIVGPSMGSVALHAALTVGIVLYYILGGFFHSNLWGGATAGGAIRVNIVSSAIPLPSDQPQNENVLATDKPSPAPEIPEVKEQAKTIDMTAVRLGQGSTKLPPDAKIAIEAASSKSGQLRAVRRTDGQLDSTGHPGTNLDQWARDRERRRLRHPVWLLHRQHSAQDGIQLE